MKRRLFKITLVFWVASSIFGFGMSILFKFRLLPCLHEETTLSRGVVMPTVQFADQSAKTFFVFAVFATTMFGLNYATLRLLNKKSER